MVAAKGNLLIAAILALWGTLSISETRRCPETDVIVVAQDSEEAALVCDAAQIAAMLFASCGVPALTGQTVIEIVDEMRSRSFGVYTFETQSIEVVAPDAMHDARQPDSIFAHVSTPAYFQSIVVHELTHAATDGMPCPYEGCIVGPEYIAYLMQMKSLDPAAQDRLAGSIDMDAPVAEEQFHPFILMLDPDVFSQRVWSHHHQQDDPCGFVGGLIRGEIFLDVLLFEPEWPN